MTKDVKIELYNDRVKIISSHNSQSPIAVNNGFQMAYNEPQEAPEGKVREKYLDLSDRKKGEII
jgi:hypothetical protein